MSIRCRTSGRRRMMAVGNSRSSGAVTTVAVAAVIVRVRMIGRTGRGEMVMMVVVVSCGRSGGGSGCHGYWRVTRVMVGRWRGGIRRRGIAAAANDSWARRRIHQRRRSATKRSSTTTSPTVGHVMNVVVRCVMVQRPCRTAASAVSSQSNAGRWRCEGRR